MILRTKHVFGSVRRLVHHTWLLLTVFYMRLPVMLLKSKQCEQNNCDALQYHAIQH